MGVKYSPTVMSRAPPLESTSSSWKTPLPNVWVPTTVARRWSWSAAVTISAEEAVLASTSTTAGIEGEIASPSAIRVWVGWVRPRVVTIVPFVTKMLAISCASSTSPPPLPRRSSTMPLAPLCSSRSTASRTSAWAPGLNVASATTPSFVVPTVRIEDATTGSEMVARVIWTVRLDAWPAPRSISSRTSVPGRPLISAVAASGVTPCSERPFTPTISSPERRPARAAGEESNTCAIERPRLSGPTATPIPVKCGGELNSWYSAGLR